MRTPAVLHNADSTPVTGPLFAFCGRGDLRDPAAFSGAPRSLIDALTQIDFEPLVINTALPDKLQRAVLNLMAVRATPPRALISRLARPADLRLTVRSRKPTVTSGLGMFRLLSSVARVRLALSPRITHAVQFGCEYRLPRNLAYVTLDDATIEQLRRDYSYDWMQQVPGVTLDGMIARQRAVYARASACCFLNGWAAESAISDYQLDPARVHVVGTGSNRRAIPPVRDWSNPRFLFVGMDFSRKNGEGVLAAFARVRRTHANAQLDVVGRHPPITQDGVRGHGVLRLDSPAESARLDQLFAEATCLVLPSLLEPTGNVHAEALAAGIGSIGTTRGGVSTIIGAAGVTVRPDDIDELAGEMTRFCDPTVAEAYGELAIERAPLFTWGAVAERLVRALRPPGVDLAGLRDFL